MHLGKKSTHELFVFAVNPDKVYSYGDLRFVARSKGLASSCGGENAREVSKTMYNFVYICFLLAARVYTACIKCMVPMLFLTIMCMCQGFCNLVYPGLGMRLKFLTFCSYCCNLYFSLAKLQDKDMHNSRNELTCSIAQNYRTCHDMPQLTDSV